VVALVATTAVVGAALVDIAQAMCQYTQMSIMTSLLVQVVPLLPLPQQETAAAPQHLAHW
jgi:hypothetical protein